MQLPDEPVLPTDVEMAHPDSWLLANYYLHVMRKSKQPNKKRKNEILN